jgi:N-acetylmuramoyl-L-alanine amidase-like
MKGYRAFFGPIAVVLLVAAGVRWSPFEPHRPPVDPSGSPRETVSWADEDWAVFESTIRWALDSQLDTLPLGELMAEIGRSFIGTAYVPGTLEVDGPERLVIDFQGFDCVTFVENVFTIARFLKSDMASRLDDRGYVEGEYERGLRALRYRDNVIDGYPSRLHYFSDWIGDNERKLLVRDITEEVGGIADQKPIGFMSTHADAYRQLADPANLEQLRETEARLTESGRHVVPQAGIAAVAARIRNGDIIAATSTVEGLDVAHTGLALWVDGTLRLLHAPLVGDSIRISEVSLAERVGRIDGQDGIIIARPTGR